VPLQIQRQPFSLIPRAARVPQRSQPLLDWRLTRQLQHSDLSLRRGISEKGLALDLQRHVRSIPAAIDENQVLLALEAQQRGRLEPAALGALGEKDR